MHTRQKVKLNKYRESKQHYYENSSISSPTPAFLNAFAQFKAKIVELIATTQLAETALDGIAVDKSVNKDELSKLAADLAGLISAYATVESAETLKEEVNYPYSTLYRTRDDELTPICEIILNRATTNLAVLADYGVTQDRLDELENAIREYSQDVPKPRAAISERKTQKANQRRLFKESDAILKDQLDKLVVTFNASNPDFVETYKNARIIIDPATTTTELRGTITASSTGEEIHNATIEIVELLTSTTSNSVGYYQFKPVEVGTFTVRLTADGYEEHVENDVELKLGEVNRLDVELRDT